MAVKEFNENGDDVQLIFTGLGTTWLAELSRTTHPLHDVYVAIKGNIAGACGFCANAYNATGDIKTCGIKILENYGANISYRNVVHDGYSVITF